MSLPLSTDATFTENISTGLTLVDFWATWCGPCQVMLPRLEELETKVAGKAKIMKHNVDEEPQVPSQFRIMSIPTMILFQDWQPIEKFVWVQSVDDLVKAIEKYAGSQNTATPPNMSTSNPGGRIAPDSLNPANDDQFDEKKRA